MTLVQLAGPLFLPYTFIWSGQSGNPTLDAAGEKYAVVFQAPKTGNISKLSFMTQTVTTGTATCDVRLETVDTSTGLPSGTLKDTNTNGNANIADANDNTTFEITLTAVAAVTKGDWLAMVIAPSGTFTLNLNAGISTNERPPQGLLFTASRAAQNAQPYFSVGYDDGTYPMIFGSLPPASVSSTAFNSGSTPDERGNAITMPFDCKVDSFYGAIELDGDCDVVLYDTDGATVLATATCYANIPLTTSSFMTRVFFDSEVTLSKGSTYRLVAKPTSVTSMNIKTLTFQSAASRAQHPFGADCVYTTAKDPNDITDWTDSDTQIASLALGISRIDDGDGTGGAGGFFIQ